MALFEFSILQLLVYSCVAYLHYSCLRAIYNIFFHPLARIPGPKIRAAFHFPHMWEVWTGDTVYNWHALHEEYGDIIRVNPNWVSIIKPEAWRDIYGQGGKPPIPKDPDVYFRDNGIANILSSNDADHSRIRRLLNHAFSDQAMRSQEHIINSYISLLISKLRMKAEIDERVDMMRFFNFTTFDIFGDLCFGESFGALEAEEYNEWVANLFKGLKLARVFRFLRAYPIIGLPVLALFKLFPALAKAKHKHEMYTVQKTEKRMNTKTERKDFMSYILKHNDEKGMTRMEIMATTGVMIIAGSETSATLLSGVIYYLLKSPEWLKRVQNELQSTFRDESEMTFTSLPQLKIMNAIIMETFRMYPPAPTTLPRMTTKDGAIVCGTYIPPNCGVGVAQYAAYRSSRNFKHADKFLPQRFLNDDEFQDDKRSVVQPFSVGPRNCIGQNLAWSEIRAILGKVLWHFDIELEDESSKWEKQKVFVLWDKPSLMVRLKPRKLS